MSFPRLNICCGDECHHEFVQDWSNCYARSLMCMACGYRITVPTVPTSVFRDRCKRRNIRQSHYRDL